MTNWGNVLGNGRRWWWWYLVFLQNQIFGLDKTKFFFRYSFLCQSLLQATIAASRQASSPNTSTPQQTTTTQASVSNYTDQSLSPHPAPLCPCSFYSLSFRKAGSQGNTASRNAGNPQDADNLRIWGAVIIGWGWGAPKRFLSGIGFLTGKVENIFFLRLWGYVFLV